MKNILTFLLFLKDWMLSNYKIVILSLLLACISFPKFALTYASGSGIDDPLPWVYNYFADGHYQLGKSTLFPHGPLAFLLYPLPMGNNVFVTIFIHLLCCFILCMSLFRIRILRAQENYPLVTVLLLLLLSLCELQLLLISITLTQLALFHLYSKKVNLLTAVIICVFSLYLKTYAGILCSLLLLSEFLYIIFARKDLKLSLQLIGCWVLFFCIFWLALYQSMSGSLTFLWGQYQLSSDNSEAVSYFQENNWGLIFAGLGALLLVPLLSKDKLSRDLFLLMLLPFFAGWKHAMARGEEHHVGGFLNLILLFAFLLWIISSEKNILLIVVFIFSIHALLFNLTLNEGYAKQRNFQLLRAYNLYNLVSEYDSIAKQKNRTSVNFSLVQHLPDSIRKIIGNKTADVFPWNYSYIPASRLNWQPRPVIHSYASYTPWLDKQNSEHITSGKSAHFYIWEYSDMDFNGTELDGIDSRYLLNDEPKTIINFSPIIIYVSKQQPTCSMKRTQLLLK